MIEIKKTAFNIGQIIIVTEIGIVLLVLSIISLIFSKNSIIAFWGFFSLFLITIFVSIITYFESKCIVIFLDDSIKIIKNNNILIFKYNYFRYSYYGLLGLIICSPYTLSINLNSINKKLNIDMFLSKKDYLIIKSLFDKNKY
jgi:hypothetical protein